MAGAAAATLGAVMAEAGATLAAVAAAAGAGAAAVAAAGAAAEAVAVGAAWAAVALAAAASAALAAVVWAAVVWAAVVWAAVVWAAKASALTAATVSKPLRQILVTHETPSSLPKGASFFFHPNAFFFLLVCRNILSRLIGFSRRRGNHFREVATWQRHSHDGVTHS